MQHKNVKVFSITVNTVVCGCGASSTSASRLARSHAVSGHSTYFPLSTNKHSRGLSRPTPRTQSERHSAASMHIQLAGSLPVMSAPECRTMTSTDARTVRVALALHNTATVPSRSYVPTVCRGCVAAQANICCWCFTDGPIVPAQNAGHPALSPIIAKTSCNWPFRVLKTVDELPASSTSIQLPIPLSNARQKYTQCSMKLRSALDENIGLLSAQSNYAQRLTKLRSAQEKNREGNH